MFESKVSTVRSVWGDFSSINASNAPGFVPVQCPTHQQYSITNICKSPGCIEPLCPECITSHVQLHQQTKKPAKIENIISTRLTVIEQLAKLKYEGQSDIQENIKNSMGNIDEYLSAQQKKLDIAEKKVIKIVEDAFNDLRKNMDIVSSAYFSERDKRQRQNKVKIAPLSQYVERISNYKEELQSEDYIPALIELLNQPPKKPKIEVNSPIQNYGNVQVNEKYLEEMKNDLNKFIKVEVNCKEENKVNLNRSNYHSSNNMKFSRFDRSRSNEGTQSRMRRSSSKSKIFSRNEIVQSRVDTSIKSIKINNSQKPIEIDRNNFFTQDGCLVYFRQKTRNYFKANFNYIQAGFDKIQLDINFSIPMNHRTIITPSEGVFLLGGERSDGISNKVYQLENKYYLKEMPSMHEQRSQFGACFHWGYIYVFGGLKKTQGYNWRAVTNSCERYYLKENRWENIRPLPQPAYNFQVCTFNQKIFKFGGTTQNGQSLFSIDLYHPESNDWKSFPIQLQLNSRMGTLQTSSKNLIIFGGYTGKGEKSSKCFNISEHNGSLEVFLGTQLYNQATFQNSFIHNRILYALQDGQANRSKLVMNYRHQQWKFISC